jgi:hypothetical protein
LPEPFDRFEPLLDWLLPPVLDIFRVLPIEFRHVDDFDLRAIKSNVVANGHVFPNFVLFQSASADFPFATNFSWWKPGTPQPF